MKTTILVSRGSFADIREAACAEERIDWWSGEDAAAQTVCTEAWAACELARYLPDETELRAAEDVPDGIGGLMGPTDTVILLGQGNPCLPALEARLGSHGLTLPSVLSGNAAALFGVELTDSVIITTGNYFSFAAEGIF